MRWFALTVTQPVGKSSFRLNAVCTEGREELTSMLQLLITGRPATRLTVEVPLWWFALELEVSHTAEEKQYVLTLPECEAAGKVSAGEVVCALIYL